MSFNIPGYFLDQKTKKLFKITRDGPYSLKELKKRLEREEEEELALSASTSTASIPKVNMHRKQQKPPTITQFLYQRATQGSFTTTKKMSINNQLGLSSLMTQLKSRAQVILDGPKQQHVDLLVDLTSSPDYGEIIMMKRTGEFKRLGYELNPGFHVWNTGVDETSSFNCTSLHYEKQNDHLLQFGWRPFICTNGGSILRCHTRKLPSLKPEDMYSFFDGGSIRNSNEILPCPSRSYTNCTDLFQVNCFQQKKDLFWSSSSDNNHIMVGGDQALYQLDHDFDLISKRKVKSSVFATHLSNQQQNICWIGSRNGLIQLTDLRENNQHLDIQLTPTFRQSSSITQMHELSSKNELLAVGMDGSVCIWDVRQPKISSHSSSEWNKGNSKNICENPVRQLKGHINESSRHLGFDIDLEDNMLMLAGSDGHVRIWSLYNSNSNEPVWRSEKFATPIPAAKFMINSGQHPKVQREWRVYKDKTVMRQCPGVLLFGVNKNGEEKCTMNWFTAVK